MSAALAAEGLCVARGGRAILDAVSFSIPKGAALAIVGPNGAGKSTLLKCLGGLLSPDAGRVFVDGVAASSLSRRLLARKIAYVPQAEGRLLPCTAFEFALMARYPHTTALTGPGQADYASVRAALERTGATAFAERPLDTLSGGERQKVFIAAALAQGAETLLLDEPTTFLDYRHQVEVMRLLHVLRRDEEKTIVLVTHDLNQGVAACTHAMALRDGRAIFHGTPAELLIPDRLEDIYGTPFELLTRKDGEPLVAPRPSEDAP